MALFDDQQMTPGQSQQSKRIVCFKIAQKEYAVEIERVKEIIYSKTVIPLPDTSGVIEGVIDLRGTVVPVVDLKKRLHATGEGVTQAEHILIVETRSRKLGLIVDCVSGVAGVDEKRIQSSRDFMDREISCLKGICRFEDRLILLIDLECLWTNSDMSHIESTLNTPVIDERAE